MEIQSTVVLDVRETARVLKVSSDTVRALIRSGKLHAKRLGKQRAIRIPVRSIEAYLASSEDE